MGFSADISHELSSLDTSNRALRKFGFGVGGVFALIAAFGVWRDWPQTTILVVGGLAAYLIVLGAVAPDLLRRVHRIWMTFALTLGWCTSRLILTLVFALAVVPIALLGRVMKLPFTKLRRATPQDSYWVDHPSRSPKHHTDMF